MDEPKVLFVIASQGFQPVEYTVPKTILEDAGFTIVTASDKAGIAIAKDGSTTPVDITLDKVTMNNYLGLFFIGGPGTLEHLDNNTSYKIIHEALQQNKPLGAICIATRILAKSGVLSRKRATGWNGDDQLDAIYKEYGIHYQATETTVIDDNIITATDPDAAQEFGEHIVALLQSKQSWG